MRTRKTGTRLAAMAGGVLLAAAGVSMTMAGGATLASATIRDGDGDPIGWARFTQDATGTLHLTVHVGGLVPGRHGIHIHSTGDCVPFGDAGGHLNPDGNAHGLENPAGPHDGDLPNLRVNPAGIGVLSTRTDRANLSTDSILDGNGSAIVIHEMPDNQYDQPIGGSGARIACGVIETD